MVFQRKHSGIFALIILYFSIVVLYGISVYFGFQPFEDFLGFARVPSLLLLYFYSSSKFDLRYVLALVFFQSAYLLFGSNTPESLFWGAAASVVFRLLIIVIIFKSISDINWRMLVLTSIPIFFIFFYLINLIKENVEDSYYLWMLNGLLTSILAGMAVSNYCYKDDLKSFWLLISALLFVVQVGLFFVNKFYLKQDLFLQLIILLYGISHFTFYKFMVFKDLESVKKQED